MVSGSIWPEGNGRARVVVVDDDAMVREALELTLEDSCSVLIFSAAEEALASGAILRADVVIADINLPGMDGVEFLEKIKDASHAASVIMITGYKDLNLAVSTMKKGAFDFILKPFNTDQMLIAVEKAIEKKRLSEENVKLFVELQEKNVELEKLNREIQERNVQIEKELDIARNLQQCLVPVSLPKMERVDLYQKSISAKKLGGDFFDILVFNRDVFALIFADVSGHGIPAALYAAMMKSAIHASVDPASSPEMVVGRINTFLIEGQKKMSYNYATVFYGIFDFASGLLSYCNASMPSPVLYREEGISLLAPTGPFVGIFSDSKYEYRILDLRKGDRVLFYSDGIYECQNTGDEIFGHERFLNLLYKYKDTSIETLIESVYREIANYSSPAGFYDDVMLLGVSIKEI